MIKKILLIFGTRPEAIKMAPLVHFLKKNNNEFQALICVTGQHREMLDQVLDFFDLVPDFDLDIMKKGQDLYDVTSKVLVGLKNVLDISKPDLALVHGDTTTSMAAALACFYQHIPVGHIEAGLRTYDVNNPWPEEMNRQITGRLATYHFAPTLTSKINLVKEGVEEQRITVTGNTVIDSLFYTLNKIHANDNIHNELVKEISLLGYDCKRTEDRKLVLITGHRRENFGDGFLNICNAIKTLAIDLPDVDFVYPMHLNPNVREPINQVFGKEKFENLFFIEPLNYLPFVLLMFKSSLILTDSGGIQEEAPSLGKPVLVMRDTTERPEALSAGTVKLVGTNYDKIVRTAKLLLEKPIPMNTVSCFPNPYGDGNACERIVDYLRNL